MAGDLVSILDEQLSDLADQLGAAGVPAALDENDVPVPGAWLRVRGGSYDRLSGMTVRVDVHLIVGAGSTGPALTALAKLHDLVVPSVLTPDDDLEVVSVALPADPTTALPALRLPVDLDL